MYTYCFQETHVQGGGDTGTVKGKVSIFSQLLTNTEITNTNQKNHLGDLDVGSASVSSPVSPYVPQQRRRCGYGEGGGRGRRECNKRFEQAIESEYQIYSCDCFGFVMGLPNFLIRSRGENEASARLGKETATLAQYFKRFLEKVRLRSEC